MRSGDHQPLASVQVTRAGLNAHFVWENSFLGLNKVRAKSLDSDFPFDSLREGLGELVV